MSFLFINETSRFSNVKTRTAIMQKFQCLLFMLKQSCICYYIICMTFKNKIENVQYRVWDDAFCSETAVAFLIISAAFFNKGS